MSGYNTPVVQCDQPECREVQEAAPEIETVGELRLVLRRQGWSTGRSGGIDYCPAHSTVKMRGAAVRLS